MPEWDVAEQTTGQAQPLQAAFGGPSDVAGVEECGGAADASVVGPWEAWGQRDHGHEPWAAAAWGTAYHQHHTAKSTAGEGRSGFVVGRGRGRPMNAAMGLMQAQGCLCWRLDSRRCLRHVWRDWRAMCVMIVVEGRWRWWRWMLLLQLRRRGLMQLG